MKVNKPYHSTEPLAKIDEVETLEAQIKASFMEVFEKLLAPKMDELICYGLPHVLDTELLKKFITYNGLNVLRSDSDNARLNFLLKAWKVRNPKRGLHFLKTYLQMLYPNNFRISQLWQETSKPYPQALSNLENKNEKRTPHWLTSRILIEVTDWSELGEQLNRYAPVLQSVVGAKFVLMLSVLRELGLKTPTNIGIASGFSAFNIVNLMGECRLPKSKIRSN